MHAAAASAAAGRSVASAAEQQRLVAAAQQQMMAHQQQVSIMGGAGPLSHGFSAGRPMGGGDRSVSGPAVVSRSAPSSPSKGLLLKREGGGTYSAAASPAQLLRPARRPGDVVEHAENARLGAALRALQAATSAALGEQPTADD